MSKRLKKAGAYLLSFAVALQSMFSWGGLAVAAYAASGDGLATTAANEWQIPADGLKYAGNTPAQKPTVSSDGLVRVQKNVVPTDKENEFLVYLSLDAVSGKVFTTDTVTKMLEVNGGSIYQGGTGNGFPKAPVEGKVRTGNGTLNPNTQGKNKPIVM